MEKITGIKRIKMFVWSGLGWGRIMKAVHSSDNIVIGPWISEIGPEVQYWIPFSQYLVNAYPKKRFTVISRGGAGLWYENVTDRYFDVFDYMQLEEFRRLDAARKRRKQLRIEELDRVILERAAGDLGKNYALMHPYFLNRMFVPFWRRELGLKFIKPWLNYMPLRVPEFDPATLGLPPRYVAVKFYFSQFLPDTEKNRMMIFTIIKKLARKTPVVLLDTGFTIDDHHEDYSSLNDKNIYNIRDHMTLRDNLEVQTKVLSRAEMFVGTYGGFSCLPPLYGVSTFAIYSENGFPRTHLEVAERYYSSPPYGAYVPVAAKDFPVFERMFSS